MRTLLFPLLVLSTFLAFLATGHSEDVRTIELILDASGSMNAKLPEGVTRIEAARQAVEKLAGSLPPGTRLALRVYGHQSPKEKHDCNDIQLVVPFGDLSAIQSQVV